MSQIEMDCSKRRVWLFGHFGLTNFGNESTLQAFLFHIHRLMPNAQVTCICTGPIATANAYGIATLPISRTIISAWTPESRVGRMFRSLLLGAPCEIYRWLDGLRTLKPNDIFIIPGTGLVSDAYGLTGWGPYNLFKWSLIAKVRRCKLLVVSVGAGPLYGRLGRFFAKSALALADFRSYRDASSLRYLKSIGFEKPRDRVYPDLAWGLPLNHAVCNDARGRREDAADHRRIVGVGVMLYAGKYSVENPEDKTFRAYLDKLVGLIQWLLARDYNVRLLIGDLCDEPVIEEFKSTLRERLPEYDERRILHGNVVTVDQLLAQIAETEFVVVTRFHNVLLAFMSEKPVVAISFHHKVASLMDAAGLSEYCLDINTFSEDELISKALQVEKNAGKLVSLIKERTQAYRAALDEQYKQILEEVNA